MCEWGAGKVVEESPSVPFVLAEPPNLGHSQMVIK